MAFQNMPDLGYRDDGPLGAFFAGIQGGNANTASQLANAAAYEKLQQDQFNNPLESLGKIYDAKLAQAKTNDPNYIPAQLRGQIGQMKSQEFAGKKAEALSDSDIAYEKQRLANGLLSGQLDQKTYEEQMRMINELLAGGGQQPSAPIGFAMTPSPEYRKENYGNEGRGLTKESMLRPFMGTGYESGNPGYDETTTNQKLQQATPAAVQAERARLIAEGNANAPPSGVPAGGGVMQAQPVPTSWSGQGGMPSGAAPVFSNMSSGGLGNKPTPYSDLIPNQSVLAKMAGIRTLDPKFVGDMAKLETKVDSAEDIALKRAEAQAQAAQKHINEPKYKEQQAKHQSVIANAIAKTNDNKKLTAEEIAQYMESKAWMDQHTYLTQVASGANFKAPLIIPGAGIERGATPIQQGQANYPGLGMQPQVAPQQGKAKLTPEERAALVKQLEGK